MIVPSGLPAWTRSVSPSDYGAVSGLHNLGDCGAVNAKTDISAEEYTRMASDCAAATRSAPLFWLTFSVAAGHIATVTQCQPMWSVSSGTYPGATPYSVSFPTIAWNSTDSEFALTFPGLVQTISSVRFIRAQDDFLVAGDCRMQSVRCSTAVAGTATARLVDGAELRISGTTTGSIVSLVVF